jgi:hypothetical protein
MEKIYLLWNAQIHVCFKNHLSNMVNFFIIHTSMNIMLYQKNYFRKFDLHYYKTNKILPHNHICAKSSKFSIEKKRLTIFKNT